MNPIHRSECTKADWAKLNEVLSKDGFRVTPLKFTRDRVFFIYQKVMND